MKKTVIMRVFAVTAALAFWAWFIVLIYRDYFYFSPPVEGLDGTDAYGRNGVGAFQTYAVLSVIEFAIVYLIVRPHSLTKTFWQRSLVALPPLATWTFLVMLGAMHQGSVYGLHLLWLLSLNLLLGVLALTTYIYQSLSENYIPDSDL